MVIANAAGAAGRARLKILRPSSTPARGWSGLRTYDVCGEVQTVAATEIELTGQSELDLEHLEGMLVTFTEPLTVTGNRNLGVFGELVLVAEGRLFNPTDAIDPDEPDNSAVSAAAANHRPQILLDDGSDLRAPDPPPFLTEGIPAALDLLRGDRDPELSS